jgi:hypothetical protein
MLPPVESITVPTSELVTVCPQTTAKATIKKKTSSVTFRIDMD